MPSKKSRRKTSLARQERECSASPKSSFERHSSNEPAKTGVCAVVAKKEVKVKPAPERRGTRKTLKEEAESRYKWPCRILGVLCALLLASAHLYFRTGADRDFPCECIASGSGPLVSALASKRLGLTGVHLHTADRAVVEKELTTLLTCVVLHRLTGVFKDVTELSTRLRNDAASAKCIIWFIQDVAVVRGVANSLKELLEENTLRGDEILPEGSRGLFVLVSDKSRKELTEVLPHRVVHMFHTMTV
ncbi:hypothetical protein BCY84_04992 [Trypanosoma cruzi cruzi]|uniref:Uncharacterized protein n=1 Tax=Trypanosoma cruzi TaxID=5693 RepID=A0A2V2VAN1_TRYCR|nr:hypothetical protein BCY84_04989 [Trypanosoma cruzi cruzi]PBJ78129.1 hypothetical protein BCY84_04992 [Trypanosoma cruzi cruzi]PWU93321.1 hypothetical protein C4B63_32g216 [Trypanosoma cruzi]PWU93324.1 hypothetical protein C4B63_32g213 [Trypanosoma cruzi]